MVGRIVVDVAGADILLDAADPVREAGRAGPDPDPRQLVVAGIGIDRFPLARRRIAIKPALLDQSVVAGIGNIYAAEALWLARIDPRLPASQVGAREAERLVRAIRRVLARGRDGSGRYQSAATLRLNVYDREGKRCSRCGTRIARIVQGARSTYWCPGCQVSPAPRAAPP